MKERIDDYKALEQRINNLSAHQNLLERELVSLRNRVLELEARVPEPSVGELLKRSRTPT